MSIYEKRTYDIQVGQMADVVRLYRDEGYPALEAGGFDQKLVGYFISDTGRLHQLIHLWRFDDDQDRRDFWRRLFADESFMAFAGQLRPKILTQEIQLLSSAPWGPTP
ncbi:MAG: NIPSNAP family protein [Actinomycetota bacterium]